MRKLIKTVDINIVLQLQLVPEEEIKVQGPLPKAVAALL